jgi:hypothetical protein
MAWSINFVFCPELSILTNDTLNPWFIIVLIWTYMS